MEFLFDDEKDRPHTTNPNLKKTYSVATVLDKPSQDHLGRSNCFVLDAKQLKILASLTKGLTFGRLRIHHKRELFSHASHVNLCHPQARKVIAAAILTLMPPAGNELYSSAIGCFCFAFAFRSFASRTMMQSCPCFI